jgi:hypothetical protein
MVARLKMPIPFHNENFPQWMALSRAIQLFLATVILSIDAWDMSLKSSITTDFGNTTTSISVPAPQDPFAGLIIFTVLVTFIVIVYDLIAPRKAPKFYHVYGELVAEFLLLIFWLAAFALAATYVQDLSLVTSELSSLLGPDYYDLFLSAIHKSESCSIAIAVLGAVLFVLTLANLIFLVAYVIQKRRARKAGEAHASGTVGFAATDNPVLEKKSATGKSEEVPPGFLV